MHVSESMAPSAPRRRDRRESVFFALVTALLLTGVAAALLDHEALADAAWVAAALLGLAVSIAVTVIAVRRHELTVDVIALLALAGSLWIGEPLAAAIISVMLATGRLLEARAAARAERDLSLLVSRAPRHAKVQRDGLIEDIPVDGVVRGDRLIVGVGDIVPVDGRLLGPGLFDESALTGESVPVKRAAGEDVRSGVVNAGHPVDILATSTAAQSTYADIVRMVEQAQASSAPFVRTADRFAVAFVPLTLALAFGAWLATGDPERAVAVLVVATPCPLLLAAPIAIMSGLSRCSRAGVVVKGGGALERLADGRILLFDKTGTLTAGRPAVVAVVPADDSLPVAELVRLAASVDQYSPHVLATAIVRHARQRGADLVMPTQVSELPGYGLSGRVVGHTVWLGKASWIVGDHAPLWVRRVRRRASLDGSLTVFVSIDGRPAGAFLLADPIRADAARMIRRLRSAGIERTVLVTGDRPEVADTVGRIVGIDTVVADRDPARKVAVVRAESATGPTIMVGDGVNDAPALATAGVGVALASRGASASSQTADVVLTVDRIGALATAITVAKRSRRIALQAVVVGMGLSGVAMVVAALGYLPPVYGALLQEVIDVAAMLIALRAVIPERSVQRPLSGEHSALVAELMAEHNAVAEVVEQIRTVADNLSVWGITATDTTPVIRLLERLEGELLPHELAEEQRLYPVVAPLLGGTDPLGPLSRSHAEIGHQIGRLRRLLDEVGDQPLAPDDIVELQRSLYGLYAVMRLHNAQEEEGIFSLAGGG